MVKQDGQLVAQHPRLLCGSVSVEFLRAWGAASSAISTPGAVGQLKSGQVWSEQVHSERKGGEL